MVGAKDGKGGFFPEGIAGRINTPEGFDALAEGTMDWDGKTEAMQVGIFFFGLFPCKPLWVRSQPRERRHDLCNLCFDMVAACYVAHALAL